MKKIALLTWITYENYGTFLQWYALTTVLKNLGYSVDSIHYIPRETPNAFIMPDKDTSFLKYCARRGFQKLFHRKSISLPYETQSERHSSFENFQNKYFTLTNPCYTLSQLFTLNDDYDYFVCGSDQIWSPLCFDSHYFLDFVQDKSKKIAYAPSIGTDEIKNPYISEKMASLISRFANVSVRENAGKRIIKELTGQDAPVVLDPTLLLDSAEWNSVADTTYNVPGKYILCYFLGCNEKYWEEVLRLSVRENLPLVVIPVFEKDFTRSKNVPKDVGPAQFLTLVKNATFVCTDSYHGSIFSLLYKKSFAVFSRFSRNDIRNQNSRIDTFCENFNLENRRVSKQNPLNEIFSNHIDWSEPYARLAELRKKSTDYLNFAFEENTDTEFKITNTCCGCGACAAVCPKHAITIKRNEDGFLQSFVDNEKCVKCNTCRRVCPYFQTNFIIPITNSNLLYAAKSTSTEVLNISSSGGIAFELMNFFKNNYKSVTGCIYDKESLSALGVSVSGEKVEKFDLSVFQGSKYTQSDYQNVFKELKNLDGGIITGLPCQIAAANNYLELIGRRNEFFLVDIICHGVPSQNLWEKYISESRKKFRFAENPEIKFRDKPLGWAQRFISLSLRDKKINICSKKDLFYAFFLAGNCYAESCYECNYRCSSCADIRIADYWNPKFYKTHKNGISMCIPLTEKGKDILYRLENENRISCNPADIQDMFKFQQTKNTFVPLERESVLEAFKSDMSLTDIRKKYLSVYSLQQKVCKFCSFLVKVRNTFKLNKNKKIRCKFSLFSILSALFAGYSLVAIILFLVCIVGRLFSIPALDSVLKSIQAKQNLLVTEKLSVLQNIYTQFFVGFVAAYFTVLSIFLGRKKKLGFKNCLKYLIRPKHFSIHIVILIVNFFLVEFSFSVFDYGLFTALYTEDAIIQLLWCFAVGVYNMTYMEDSSKAKELMSLYARKGDAEATQFFEEFVSPCFPKEKFEILIEPFVEKDV